MSMFTKLMAGGAAIAALAAAAPASAQYYQYGYNPYATPYANPYANPYAANPYAYNNAYMTQVATQRCTAAVQSRLQTRTGLPQIIASMLGVPTAQPRVVSITRVDPNRNTIRVRGLASTGRMAAYSPWGVGAYGAAGYAYQPDLSFSCRVDYRGYVRDVDINRR